MTDPEYKNELAALIAAHLALAVRPEVMAKPTEQQDTVKVLQESPIYSGIASECFHRVWGLIERRDKERAEQT